MGRPGNIDLLVKRILQFSPEELAKYQEIISQVPKIIFSHGDGGYYIYLINGYEVWI